MHSAEWLRGAVTIAREFAPHGHLNDLCQQLSEAEAREAGERSEGLLVRLRQDLPAIRYHLGGVGPDIKLALDDRSRQSNILVAIHALDALIPLIQKPREAGEPSTECLMQILRDGQADHWAAMCGSDEGGFQPSEWVLEAEKVLAGEYSGSSLAEQLAAAKAEVEELRKSAVLSESMRIAFEALAEYAARYAPKRAHDGPCVPDAGCDAICAELKELSFALRLAFKSQKLRQDRDERMKALGAAEWLRENSNADWLDVDQRDRFKAEATRLAEVE